MLKPRTHCMALLLAFTVILLKIKQVGAWISWRMDIFAVLPAEGGGCPPPRAVSEVFTAK